nr:MAG TPA: hypothetical protein [Caudoviricetes sp.]
MQYSVYGGACVLLNGDRDHSGGMLTRNAPATIISRWFRVSSHSEWSHCND